ncbi:MAG: DEAD/DEAH box helicase [Spirochaetales bacterium]|nr:DEAD/DEAH box helicase [Spirochaetales bacterium]
MNLLHPIQEICQERFGIPSPYPWQLLIISGVLESLFSEDDERPPHQRIAVLPTGAGKSLCWMLPAALHSGLTIAVFPLLSLMRDQSRRLSKAQIPHLVFQGGMSSQEKSQLWKKLEKREIHVVLTNPEILDSPITIQHLGQFQPDFLVVDETHTVSQWGESFRPACAHLGQAVEKWNPRAVLALTATASPSLRNRIVQLLFHGQEPEQAIANADRPEIHYGVIPTLSRMHTLERLAREKTRPMVIFGRTRSQVELTARTLRHRLRSKNIMFYHAGLSPQEKLYLEEWFLESKEGILCATSAYGIV